MVVKTGNAPNNPKLNQWKVLCMHESLTSEGKILIRFALQALAFETQGCRKSKMHWMTSYWTLRSKLFYVLWILSLEARILVRLLYDKPFPR